MVNLFKLPIEKSSLEAWSKLSDDVAKVAILAMPVILYGETVFLLKVLNIASLLVVTYFCLAVGRIFVNYRRRNNMWFTIGLGILALISIAAFIFATYAAKHS